MDYNFINGRIAVGAAISGDTGNIQVLADAGINYIVDCQTEFDDSASCTARGMHVLTVGVSDDGQPKPTSWFASILEFSFAALRDPHGKIYFHCAAGINRGPSAAYSFLRALGFDRATSEAMIRRVRPQVGLAYKLDADRALKELGYSAD